jgi:hypothetical protein
MRPFHLIVAMTSLLGLGVTAGNLWIHTQVDLKPALNVVTLKSDWSLDKTSKEEYLKSYPHTTIDKGGGTLFELSGMMEWDSEWSDGKRAFWVTDAEDPFSEDGVVRGWQKVSTTLCQGHQRHLANYRSVPLNRSSRSRRMFLST